MELSAGIAYTVYVQLVVETEREAASAAHLLTTTTRKTKASIEMG